MRGSTENGFLNYNPFLNVREMAKIKNQLDVLRNIKEYDHDVVEDYDFNFMDEENGDGDMYSL